MDERDFLTALKSGGAFSKEASEYFTELRKSAGVKDMAAKTVGDIGAFVTQRKAPLLGATLGAATATALQYLANKSKDGKPSKQRQVAEKNMATHDKSMAELQTQGKEPTFDQALGHARAKSSVDIARISEKHPGRGALLAAPAGAVLGYGIGALARKIVG
jgi:hypothetical protein